MKPENLPRLLFLRITAYSVVMGNGFLAMDSFYLGQDNKKRQ
jgi:hypothetical protein